MSRLAWSSSHHSLMRIWEAGSASIECLFYYINIKLKLFFHSSCSNAFPTTPIDIDRTTATFKYNKDSYFFLLVTTPSKDY